MPMCDCMRSMFVCVCGYISYVQKVNTCLLLPCRPDMTFAVDWALTVKQQLSIYLSTFAIQSYNVVTTIVIICFKNMHTPSPHPPHYVCIMAYCQGTINTSSLSSLSLGVCVCVCVITVSETVIKGAIKSHHKMENWLQIKQQSIFLPLQCLYQSCKLFRKFIINYFGLTSLCVSHDM